MEMKSGCISQELNLWGTEVCNRNDTQKKTVVMSVLN